MCTLDKPLDDPLGTHFLFTSSYTTTEARADAIDCSLQKSKYKFYIYYNKKLSEGKNVSKWLKSHKV